MNEAKKEVLFKTGVFVVVAVCAILLPGAISGKDAALQTPDPAFDVAGSVAGMAGELTESFTRLGEKDPRFVLEIISQKYEQRHGGLWK